MFYVGQKVVCVDDHDNRYLKSGVVYTIIAFEWVDERSNNAGVLLAETKHNSGCPFLQKRFRPLVERKTDISVFIALLNPAKTDA